MTTQRPLSAAAPASEGYPYPAVRLAQRMRWHRPARRGRHSNLPRGGSHCPKGPCAVARIQSIEAAASLPTEWHRRSCLCAVAKPGIQSIEAIPSLPAKSPRQFLIANPELELNVRPLRINDLRFSNRKFSAIFPFIFLTLKDPHPRPVIVKASDQDARPRGSQLAPHSIPSQQTQVKLLIETPRFRIPITPTKQIQSQFLIETNQPLCAATTLASPPTFRPFPPLC
jgi:hypothetical protein